MLPSTYNAFNVLHGSRVFQLNMVYFTMNDIARYKPNCSSRRSSYLCWNIPYSQYCDRKNSYGLRECHKLIVNLLPDNRSRIPSLSWRPCQSGHRYWLAAINLNPVTRSRNTVRLSSNIETAVQNLTKWRMRLRFFSCDQAALWMVQSVCPYVHLSVRPSHLFDYVRIIVSSWNFQELLPMTKVMSMQNVKVRGQRSRSQRSWPHLAVSGP